MSAFDENTINMSQFVQLTETFLGDNPALDLFSSLCRFMRDGYVETEEEKMARLMRVSHVYDGSISGDRLYRYGTFIYPRNRIRSMGYITAVQTGSSPYEIMTRNVCYHSWVLVALISVIKQDHITLHG